MQRHQYQTRNQVILSHLSQLLSAVRTADGHTLLHLNFTLAGGLSETTIARISHYKNDLTESPDSDSNYCLSS